MFQLKLVFSLAITELQQATRALIIIAAIFNFFSLIICFYFGVNRWERPRGAYYVGALFLLAGKGALIVTCCLYLKTTHVFENKGQSPGSPPLVAGLHVALEKCEKKHFFDSRFFSFLLCAVQRF